MSRTCTRCVMDETEANINFDSQGHCNHCNTYFELTRIKLRPVTEFTEMVNQVREHGKNHKYHLIIGVSGGIDSTYTAYLAHKLDLNVLVCHFDNGYDTPEAIQNIQAILDNTGWDYQYLTMDFEEFRDLQLAYLRSGVKNLEATTDQAISARVTQVAIDNKIKYMFRGHNWASEGILPASWGYHNRDLVNIKDINKKNKGPKLITYPQMGILKYAFLTKINGIRILRPLNYLGGVDDLLPYNIVKAKSILTKEWGWEDYGYKHYESIITRFYQSYLLPVRWGIDKRRAHLSSLICSGQITRDEALQILDSDIYPTFEDDYKTVLKKLGISSSQFQQLLSLPTVEHTEYKTNHNRRTLLRLISKLW